MVVFYLCALWNIHVFPDAMLMCPMMLKHLICLNFVSAHEVLPVACPWSIIFMLFCTLIGLLVLCIPFGRYGIMLICGLLVPPEVYMHEEFMLAYFVPKKGEKNGMVVCLNVMTAIMCCIYFATMSCCV